MKFIVLLYTFLFSFNLAAAESKDQLFSKMNPKDDPRIKQVKLETSGCFGSCPIYSIIISADGTVEYTGTGFVEFKGTRKGVINKWYVEQLFDFVDDVKFFDFRDKYTTDITDNATTYTTVTMFNGKTKTVENYANTAPVRLWALEELISGFQNKTKWEKVKK